MQTIILRTVSILCHYPLSNYWGLVYHISIIKGSHKEAVYSFPNSYFFSFFPQVTKLSLFYSKNFCISKRTHLGILEILHTPTGAMDCCVNVFTVSINICPARLLCQSDLLSLRGLAQGRPRSSLNPPNTKNIAMHTYRKQLSKLLVTPIARLWPFSRKLVEISNLKMSMGYLNLFSTQTLIQAKSIYWELTMCLAWALSNEAKTDLTRSG